MSKSLPFLLAPKNTKGYVGDVGFDPLGFSDYFDMKWLRESEIKHGRVSMLAVAGYVMQGFLTIPGMTHVQDQNMAPQAAGLESMLQLIFGLGIWEWWTNKGNMTMENMFSDSSREPGNFGFDPMGFSKGKSQAEMEELQLKEIKNGRLAMLAIGGMIHQGWVTGEPLF